jgi:anti-sigma B factor antagonist
MTQSFAVRRHDDGDGAAHLAVTGEIDGETCDALVALIANAAARPGTEALVVDLARVTFLDASGVRALLRGAEVAARHNIGYSLANPGEIVRHILDVTGVALQLPISVTEAPFATRPGG